MKNICIVCLRITFHNLLIILFISAALFFKTDFSYASIIYVDINGNDAKNGSSWNDAKRTIKSALAIAVEGDQIWVKKGTYTESIGMVSGIKLYGGFWGFEKTLSERHENSRSLIDVSKVRNYQHGITVWGTINTLIDGFKVINCKTSYTWLSGSAIFYGFCDNTNILSNCEATSNSTAYYGAIAVHFKGSPIIDNCFIYNNFGNGSGGIGIGQECSPVISNCRISANKTWWSGGAITVSENSTVELINCIISGNYAGSGGSCYFSNSKVNMKNCLIIGNNTYHVNKGGTIYDNSMGDIKNCIFSNNYASTAGGIYCINSSSPKIINCIFDNVFNYAVYESDIASDPQLINNIFYNNPNGDVFDFEAGGLTGATAINSISGNSNNVDKNPNYKMNSKYSITGKWTEPPINDFSKGETIFIDSKANYKKDSLAGKILNPDIGAIFQWQWYIIRNTEKEIIIAGIMGGLTNPYRGYKISDYRPDYNSAAIDAVTSKTLTFLNK